MSNAQMIRKQLYITREQNRALKERAREQGASEAEVVREALDRHLRQGIVSALPTHRRKALEELLATNEEIVKHHRFPKDYQFNRDALYAEREAGWFKES